MKKKFLLSIIALILLILDIYLFYNYIFARYRNKIYLEKFDITLADELSNSSFVIDKVMLYSSASARNKNSNFQETNWLLDIFEYTDIAIYFKKPTELNSNNSVEALSISNVNLQVSSNRYTPELYYLDANKFGTESILSNYKIKDTLDFTVLNFDNKDNSIMYNTPVFFSDLSNPITLKFTNTLFKNYSIESTEKLTFNGSLLSKTPIKLADLKALLSFNINISNFEKEVYSTNISLEIPLENEKNNIFRWRNFRNETNEFTTLKNKRRNLSFVLIFSFLLWKNTFYLTK